MRHVSKQLTATAYQYQIVNTNLRINTHEYNDVWSTRCVNPSRLNQNYRNVTAAKCQFVSPHVGPTVAGPS